MTEVAAGREGHSLSLATAAHCYWVALGPGRASFADGVQIETDGSAAMLRDRGVAFLAAGRRLRVITPEGDLEVRLDRPGNAFVDFTTSVVQATPLVAYTTVSGTQVPSPEPAVTTTASGSLWRRSPSEPR